MVKLNSGTGAVVTATEDVEIVCPTRVSVKIMVLAFEDSVEKIASESGVSVMRLDKLLYWSPTEKRNSDGPAPDSGSPDPAQNKQIQHFNFTIVAISLCKPSYQWQR